jgi:hypothetical protein
LLVRDFKVILAAFVCGGAFIIYRLGNNAVPRKENGSAERRARWAFVIRVGLR